MSAKVNDVKQVPAAMMPISRSRLFRRIHEQIEDILVYLFTWPVPMRLLCRFLPIPIQDSVPQHPELRQSRRTKIVNHVPQRNLSRHGQVSETGILSEKGFKTLPHVILHKLINVGLRQIQASRRKLEWLGLQDRLRRCSESLVSHSIQPLADGVFLRRTILLQFQNRAAGKIQRDVFVPPNLMKLSKHVRHMIPPFAP